MATVNFSDAPIVSGLRILRRRNSRKQSRQPNAAHHSTRSIFAPTAASFVSIFSYPRSIW